jgi:hypothetical protein
MKIHRDSNILFILVVFIVVSIVLINQFDYCKKDYKQKSKPQQDSDITVEGILSGNDLEEINIYSGKEKIALVTDGNNGENTNRTQHGYNITVVRNYTEKSDVVSDIGNNIGDGLQPLDTTTTLLVSQAETNKAPKSISLHNLLTFIGLTFLITFIFLLSIYFRTEKPKTRDIGDEYRLLVDKVI